MPSFPREDEEVGVEDVTLAVETTSGAVSYLFQVFSDAGLTTLVHEATAVAATAGTTSIVLDDVLTDAGVDGDDPGNPEDVDLADDAEYEWRVCAFDGAACSPWSAPQRFRYDPTNDPPGAPTLDSPLSFGHVTSLAPALVAGNPAADDDPPAR